MSRATAGEESESDLDDEDTMETHKTPTLTKDAEPSSNTHAQVHGEETESEEEDADFGKEDPEQANAQGDVEDEVPAAARLDASAIPVKLKARTRRHQILRERNKQIRKAVLTKTCAQPRRISRNVQELNTQLIKHQLIAQDVSGSIKILNEDLATIHRKIRDLLDVDGYMGKKAVFASYRMPKVDMSELQQEITRAFHGLPSFVQIAWIQNNLLEITVSQSGISTIHWRFQDPVDRSALATAEACLDVVETHRHILPFHTPYVVKVDETFQQYLAKAGATVLTPSG